MVGNGRYAHIGRLSNPGNDAADMTAALRRLGFEVTTVRDAGGSAMTEALRVFTRRSAGADVSLVFYAGHGLEMDGVNYLVPVDARLERDTDVRFEAVTLDDMLASTVGAGLRVVILDACRNNPLARSMQRTGAARSVSRGSFGDLDESLLGDETLVAYAAAAGTTADDGAGRNSPYTSALLAYLERRLEIGLLFREVRARVLEATEGRQRPHEYASLLGEHYLRAAVGADPRAVESALALDRAARRRVQRGLTAAGFSPGPADGVFGPATRAAIRGWQTSLGATASGYLDAAEAQSLGVPVVAAAPAEAAVPEPRDPAASAVLAQQENLFWQSIMTSANAADFEAYLRRFPDGVYADLARNRAAALAPPAETAAPDPPPADPTEPGSVFRDCPACPEMVVVPAGTFLMGSDRRDDESFDNERPRHRVTVEPFALGVHEVTRDEYQAFAAATGRGSGDRCLAFDAEDERFDWREEASWRSPGYPQTGDHPVACVNWEDAQAYARWLSTETGQAYRLPSEAEWEYAARAGTTTRRHWGDDPDDGCAYANGADRTAKRRFDNWTWVTDCTDGVLWTSLVGAYEPNALGLHDMPGNVSEWVEDCCPARGRDQRALLQVPARRRRPDVRRPGPRPARPGTGGRPDAGQPRRRRRTVRGPASAGSRGAVPDAGAALLGSRDPERSRRDRLRHCRRKPRRAGRGQGGRHRLATVAAPVRPGEVLRSRPALQRGPAEPAAGIQHAAGWNDGALPPAVVAPVSGRPGAPAGPRGSRGALVTRRVEMTFRRAAAAVHATTEDAATEG